MPTCAALLADRTHVFHLAAQAGVRKSWGTRLRRLHGQQHRGDAGSARSRLPRADARAHRVRVELVGVRRQRRDADARGRAAAAGLAVRRDEAGRPNSSATSTTRTTACRRSSLRYFTVYGPRQRPDMGFHKFLRARRAATQLPCTVTASRHATSRMCTMRSAATAAAAVRGVPGRVYNIGGGSRVSINQVFEMIGRVSGRTPRHHGGSGAEGRHAAHLRRHVAGAGRSRVQTDGRARRRNRGRIQMAVWSTVKKLARIDRSWRLALLAAALGASFACAHVRPGASCRPARPNPTSSCSTRATRRSKPSAGSSRANTSSRSSRPTRRVRIARTPSSASATRT